MENRICTLAKPLPKLDESKQAWVSYLWLKKALPGFEEHSAYVYMTTNPTIAGRIFLPINNEDLEDGTVEISGYDNLLADALYISTITPVKLDFVQLIVIDDNSQDQDAIIERIKERNAILMESDFINQNILVQVCRPVRHGVVDSETKFVIERKDSFTFLASNEKNISSFKRGKTETDAELVIRPSKVHTEIQWCLQNCSLIHVPFELLFNVGKKNGCPISLRLSDGKNVYGIASIKSDTEHDSVQLSPSLHYFDEFNESVISEEGTEAFLVARGPSVGIASRISLRTIPTQSCFSEKLLKAANLCVVQQVKQKVFLQSKQIFCVPINSLMANSDSVDILELTRNTDAYIWYSVEEIDPLNTYNIYYTNEDTSIVFDTQLSHRLLPSLRKPLLNFVKVHPPSQKLLRFCRAFFDPQQVPGFNPFFLLHGNPFTGKTKAVEEVASLFSAPVFTISSYEFADATADHLEAKLDMFVQNVVKSPCAIIFVKDLDVLSISSDEGNIVPGSKSIQILLSKIDLVKSPQGRYIVIGTCHLIEKIPYEILSESFFELKFSELEMDERLELLKIYAINVIIDKRISLKDVALKTNSMSFGELECLPDHMTKAAVDRIKRTGYDNDSIILSGPIITEQDVDVSINRIRKEKSNTIFTVPKVNWDDIGGLEEAKTVLRDTLQLPLQFPELFSQGLKPRSGVLLYGPPGTGKTLLAKAVATELSLEFVSIKGPELLNMYVGESEANVRNIFEKARNSSPCVIFFDELDSIAPHRGNSSDSGNVMDRVVSQLLAELDSISKDNNKYVFVIGATNRPDLLDPSLLRPGRFDKLVYLGINKSEESKASMLRALTKTFKLDETIDLNEIAKNCHPNFTGADMYALCSDAVLSAIKRKTNEIDLLIQASGTDLSTEEFFKRNENQDSLELRITKEDFLTSLKKLRPSISEQELHRYEMVRHQFS
ncbi:Peroxisomal ATPase pex6 [Schizosaccharomyces pombe]